MDLQRSNGINPEVYGFTSLVEDMWAAKWRVLAVTLGLCIAGICAGILLPKQYTVSLIFEPVLSETSSGELGGMNSVTGGIGGLSGLAALAGIKLPGKTEDEVAVAVLQSQLLTRSFIQANNLLPVLFANKWNPVLKQWKVSDDRKIPTLWLASQFFDKKVRTVSQDEKSGLYVLKIRWTNPSLAASWANDLVAMTNAYLRNQAVQEGERNIQYLGEQAAKTTDVEVKQVIYTLLEEEIDKEMIAKGRREYALKIVDPGFAPQKPSSLGVVVLGAIGFLVGGLLCVLVLFFRGVLSTG